MRPNPMIERKLRKVRSHPPVAVYPLVGLDDPAATAITPEMFHPSQIGIYRSCEFRRLLFSATSAIDIEHLPETADHTMARIDPSGLDIPADEQYAPLGALQENFTGMKRQMCIRDRGLPVLAHTLRTQRTEYKFVLLLFVTDEPVGVTLM